MKLWGLQADVKDASGNSVWNSPFIVKAETGLEATRKGHQRIFERAGVDIQPGCTVEIRIEWGDEIDHP